MKVLIIEDEVLTSRRMKKLIHEIDESIEVIDILDSIEASVKWFKNNAAPDLIFMDIQLSDGLSFEIFQQVTIDCPVVFTTAFDEYAIQAFKVNSIDYLLKPVNSRDLAKSLGKFNRLKEQYSKSFDASSIQELLKKMTQGQKEYKSRFLVKSGQAFIKVNCENIAWFTAENKLTYMILFNGKRHLIDYTLEALEVELDPSVFLRINRQFIININSIESVHNYFNGALKVYLNPQTEEEVIISRRRVNAFKEWMDK